MLSFLCIAAITLLPNQAEFSSDAASILVEVNSNIYTYKVTNLSSDPIVHFEIPQHASYNFKVPDGWLFDGSNERFTAWCDNPADALRSDETAQFSLRSSSTGSVLGKASAVFHFQSDRTITIPDVWAPSPEPKSYIHLIVITLLVIVLGHTFIIYISRKAKKVTANDG